jgi:hypothetical protein
MQRPPQNYNEEMQTGEISDLDQMFALRRESRIRKAVELKGALIRRMTDYGTIFAAGCINAAASVTAASHCASSQRLAPRSPLATSMAKVR